MGTYCILKRGHILFGILLLFLLVVDCSDDNFQVKDDLKLKSSVIGKDNSTNNAIEQKGSTSSVVVAPVKKDEQVEKSKEIVQDDFDKRNATGESLQPKESEKQKISEGSLDVELKDKDKENGSIGGLGKGVDSKEMNVEGGGEESSGSLMGVKEEKSRDEECDPSNMCIDEKKNLTACLRVPGNDSPDLSLLIRNKGSRPVSVTITAPNFVQLEQTKVLLQQKEDKKVKVTLAYEGRDSLIFLTTEDSRCTLDFRDFVPRDSRIETGLGFKIRYLNSLTRTHWLIFLSLTAFLVFGSACMLLGLRKKLGLANGYQTVDMELPVSAVSKTGTGSKGGWDSSWDDSWGDDEEASRTPTLPVTPNLSSRRLASRRLSKEAWKD